MRRKRGAQQVAFSQAVGLKASQIKHAKRELFSPRQKDTRFRVISRYIDVIPRQVFLKLKILIIKLIDKSK